MRSIRLATALMLLSGAASPVLGKPAPLPEEPIPSVQILPQTYPASWILVVREPAERRVDQDVGFRPYLANDVGINLDRVLRRSVRLRR